MVTIVHSDSSHFKNLFLRENYLTFGLFVEAHFKSEFNRNLLRGTRETKKSILLKWFCSDIEDGSYGSHHEILQRAPLLEPHVLLNRNLIGGICATGRQRIAKIITFNIRDGYHISHRKKRHIRNISFSVSRITVNPIM